MKISAVWLDKENGIAEVIHQHAGFLHNKTQSEFVDMKRKIRSANLGFPDNSETTKMDERDINWFNKYYRPLANEAYNDDDS